MSQSLAEAVQGPVLIGMFFNVVLLGVYTVQIHLYQKSSWRDNIWVRTFIYLLFLAEALQTLFVVIFVYDALVVNFGNLRYLTHANWVVATDPAFTGIIGGSVQIFYVRRLRILTRNWMIVSVVSICAVATILMGIATAAAIHFVPEYTEFRRFKVVVIVWLVSAVIADTVITVSLVTYLNKWRKTVANNTYIDHVVQMTIQTGLLTSAWAIIDLALYLAKVTNLTTFKLLAAANLSSSLFNKPTGLHLIFNFSLSKLYSNSLMSSLNARDFWKFDSSAEANIQSVSGLKFSTRDSNHLGTSPALKCVGDDDRLDLVCNPNQRPSLFTVKHEYTLTGRGLETRSTSPVGVF